MNRLTAPDDYHGHSHSHRHSHYYNASRAIETGITKRNLRKCQFVTVVGGGVNVFFSTTKIWIGSSGGSAALVADGFHALTDIISDTVSFACLSLARTKMPRCRFPFGIGRLETSGAILVAAILLAGGVVLLIESISSCTQDFRLIPKVVMGAERTNPPSHHDDGMVGHSHSNAMSGHSHFQLLHTDGMSGKLVVLWAMATLALFSVVSKELLFRWTKHVGEQAGSRVVVANAYHHRADAWSGAVALLGIVGQTMGVPGIDGIAGVVISFSICKMGYQVLVDSILEFFDYQNADDVARVREQLLGFQLHALSAKHVVLAMSDAESVEGDVTPRGAVTLTKAGISPGCHFPPTDTLLDLSDASVSLSSIHDKKPFNTAGSDEIRFINVFLTRHGPDYALHLTLLVQEDLTALQLQDAIMQLNFLCKKTLSVRDTFVSVQVCSMAVVIRETYLAHVNLNSNARPRSGEEAGEPLKHLDEAHSVFVAAQGEMVNSTLEYCLNLLSEFHGFEKPITYDWDKRELYIEFARGGDCYRDAESVAKMFRCHLKNQKDMKKK